MRLIVVMGLTFLLVGSIEGPKPKKKQSKGRRNDAEGPNNNAGENANNEGLGSMQGGNSMEGGPSGFPGGEIHDLVAGGSEYDPTFSGRRNPQLVETFEIPPEEYANNTVYVGRLVPLNLRPGQIKTYGEAMAKSLSIGHLSTLVQRIPKQTVHGTTTEFELSNFHIVTKDKMMSSMNYGMTEGNYESKTWSVVLEVWMSATTTARINGNKRVNTGYTCLQVTPGTIFTVNVTFARGADEIGDTSGHTSHGLQGQLSVEMDTRPVQVKDVDDVLRVRDRMLTLFLKAIDDALINAVGIPKGKNSPSGFIVSTKVTLQKWDPLSTDELVRKLEILGDRNTILHRTRA